MSSGTDVLSALPLLPHRVRDRGPHHPPSLLSSLVQPQNKGTSFNPRGRLLLYCHRHSKFSRSRESRSTAQNAWLIAWANLRVQ